MVKKISYSEAFEELQQIVDEIESGETEVDVLSAKVKRAVELIKICKKVLRSTETDIEQVLDDLEEKEE